MAKDAPAKSGSLGIWLMTPYGQKLTFGPFHFVQAMLITLEFASNFYALPTMLPPAWTKN